jgi:hypothetical protein
MPADRSSQTTDPRVVAATTALAERLGARHGADPRTSILFEDMAAALAAADAVDAAAGVKRIKWPPVMRTSGAGWP